MTALSLGVVIVSRGRFPTSGDSIGSWQANSNNERVNSVNRELSLLSFISIFLAERFGVIEHSLCQDVLKYIYKGNVEITG